jgi:choline kinase
MKAVILAAGTGTRLFPLTADKPKALLDIGGISLIQHQLEKLNNNGFGNKQVYLIGGYRIEAFDFLKQRGVNVIDNPKYDEFNNIYSFYLLKDAVNEDFLLLNCDVLFHERILVDVLKSECQNVLAIDNVKALSTEEMKVIIKNDRITKISKDINPEAAQGEYLGIAKFSIKEAQLLFAAIEQLMDRGCVNLWYEDAINSVISKIGLYASYSDGLPWIEVDTLRDYETAQKIYAELAEAT